jgi:hypothetical protein
MVPKRHVDVADLRGLAAASSFFGDFAFCDTALV